MDQTVPAVDANRKLYRGVIGVGDTSEVFSNLIPKQEKLQTQFCLATFGVLIVVSLVFPRTIGASGVTYKIREIFLIFAFVSFIWTSFHKTKLWEFSKIRQLFAFLFSFLILFGLTTGLLLFHGIEERTDRELQARSYMNK